MRTSFEIVSYYADIFFIKYVTSSLEESFFYEDLYHIYIKSCGWSSEEFDAELLRRINNSWDLMYN